MGLYVRVDPLESLFVCADPPSTKMPMCGPPPRPKNAYISSAVSVCPEEETCLPGHRRGAARATTGGSTRPPRKTRRTPRIRRLPTPTTLLPTPKKRHPRPWHPPRSRCLLAPTSLLPTVKTRPVLPDRRLSFNRLLILLIVLKAWSPPVRSSILLVML